ncbi:TPA: hypothetical protein QB072_001957 [Pasteurella multocida]|uniref:hypothetical protein n=1 Tax=Pasteurella multocida TaxID=747 RepID=UPI0002EF08F1|nr:hypothetical protein [Pasteurella multocida]APB78803.1 hypothetical protein BMF22_01610 [Pasteurella multocida]EPE74414.1 hypothetical protein I010_09531 [Pasteurella multocida 1500C]ERL40724.1 hypothetical protein B654_09031 [Pasteurella multocida subsp. multocida str. PMTB]KEP92922.1 hypothetical protein UQU_0209195 [Pasteurella multocida subsp. multocida VTCCBAA264]KEZ08572.1 hypothetical protein GJ37_07615 [Pasteurella multocida]
MRKAKTVKPFKPEYQPTFEQLAKAIKQAEIHLAFAKDYIRNDYLKGAADALKNIKTVVTQGLKENKGGKHV